MSLSREDQPNLLIVDDDETIQRLLVIAAKDHGWRPRTAGSGMGAVEALDPGIEAVVLDHGLPDIDGLQTLERLRAARPELPVIMLTGLNDAETAVRALRAGAADYLTKPFELKRLFDLLRQIRLARPEPVAAVTGGGVKLAPTEGLHSANPRVRELLRRMEKAASLEEAVRASARAAKPGDTVLLSPACASLDMFRDYGHRGDVFAAAVRGLQA